MFFALYVVMVWEYGVCSTGLGGYDGVLGPKNPHLPEFDTSVLVKQKGQFEVCLARTTWIVATGPA